MTVRFMCRRHSLPQEVVVIMTVRFMPLPYVAHSERILIRVLPGVPNFYQVSEHPTSTR